MRGSVLLRGSGFEWRLSCDPSRDRNWLRCTMHLVAAGAKQRIEIGPLETGAEPQEILRLASYLDDHLASLNSDPWYESPTFVWAQLPFNLQALCGEMDERGAGTFSIRVLMNVGSENDAGPNVYLGAEAAVDVEDCRRFVAELRGLGKNAVA